MSEKEKQPEISYTESEGITDFGYFHVPNNLYGLNNFEKAEALMEEFSSSLLEQLREAANFKKTDIPLELTMPPRPREDISFKGLDLSLAEMAGFAGFHSSIREGQEMVFSGYTLLGKYAKRWFKTIKLSDIKSEKRDNWLLETRGTRLIDKLDEYPTIAYITGSELTEKYNVKPLDVKRPEKGYVLGGCINFVITDDGMPRIELSENYTKIDRVSLHSLKGFCKGIYAHTTHNYIVTPWVNLVDTPLKPYSNINGEMQIDDVIRVDRIKSYTLWA